MEKTVKKITRARALRLLLTGAMPPSQGMDHPNIHVKRRAWLLLGGVVPDFAEDRNRLAMALYPGHLKRMTDFMEAMRELEELDKTVRASRAALEYAQNLVVFKTDEARTDRIKRADADYTEAARKYAQMFVATQAPPHYPLTLRTILSSAPPP